MKSIIKIFTIMVALLIIGSCNDFLDKQPLGSETSATYFNSEDNAKAAVTGIYDKIYSSGNNFAHSSNGVWMQIVEDMWMGDICSDDSEKGSNAGDFSSITDMENWTLSPNDANNIPRSLWEHSFIAINRANYVIDNIDNGTNISSSLKIRLKGEAKFLRAWFYFQLLKHFGGVPLFETSSQPSDFGSKKRATYHETFEFIAKDLLAAIEVLPEKSSYSSADMGRATKGAARAYLARLYMYQISMDKDNSSITWQNVYDQTTEIIKSGEYQLLTNYSKLFEFADGENTSESVFEVQCENGSSVSNPEQIGTWLWRWQQIRTENSKEHTIAPGWGFNNPTSNLVNAFNFSSTNDPRLTCTVFGEKFNNGVVYGVKEKFDRNQMCTYYFNRKAAEATAPKIDGASPKNILLMRFADVLLMHAEACANLAKDGEAKSYLNKIRERARNSTYCKGWTLGNPNGYTSAGTVNLPDINLTGTALIEAIWKERRLELAMEGIRSWDLIRQGKFVEVVEKAKYTDRLKVNNPVDTLEKSFPDFKVNCEKHSLTGKNNIKIPVLPIPGDEVGTWGLEQNPNYN